MNCDVIKDLLPLYADGLASEASRTVIEKHIKTCPACRRLKEQMCSPMEPEPVDEATAYMNALHAQERKRKRRTILTIVLTVLVCVMGWWIYMETHFYGERIATVSTNEEEILAEMPELALTDAEKELADTLLTFDEFREALSPDPYSYTAFDIEAVREHIAPILPENAMVTAVGVTAASVHIDYRVGDMRTILEYTDADLTGHVDAIWKYMALSPYEYVDGVQLAGDVEEVFMVAYAVGTGITQYEKMESRHDWFSFMDMP